MKALLRIILVFFILLSDLSASESVVDSLKRLIVKSNDEQQAYYYAKLSICSPNPDDQLKNAEEALRLAKSQNNKENLAMAYLAFGRYYISKNRMNYPKFIYKDSAIYSLRNSLLFVEDVKSKKQKSIIYATLGYTLDYPDSCYYFDKANRICQETGDYMSISYNLYLEGNIFIRYNVLNKADSIFRKSLEFLRKKHNNDETFSRLVEISRVYESLDKYELAYNFLSDQYWMLSTISNDNLKWEYHYKISIFLWHLAQYSKALINCEKSFEFAKKTGKPKNIALSNELYAIIYNSIGIYDNAYEYYNKALEFAEKISDDSVKTRVKMNIAVSKMEQGDYLTAVQILNENKDLFHKCTLLKTDNSFIVYLLNISECYYYLKDITKLKETNQQILAEFEKISFNKNFAIAHLSFGRLSYLTHDYLNAEKELSLALVYVEKSNDYEVKKAILDIYPEVLFKLGKTKEAYDNVKLWSIAKDSITAKKDARQIGRLESEFINREDNLKQENELKKKEQENEAKKNTIYLLLIGAILLIIFIMIVLRERSRSEKLLLNILPKQITRRLKKKEKYIAERFNDASVIFIDIANFTKLSSGIQPERLVEILNDIFTIFDNLTEKYGLEKIKTIGDCYLAASGIPEPRVDHAIAAANMAIESMKMIKEYKTFDGLNITFRIGLDCGPIVAGIIGKKKFAYDLWGDTVNTASRMEDYGVIGEIQVSGRFKDEIDMMSSKFNNNFTFIDRGIIDMKGKGQMHTWLLRESE